MFSDEILEKIFGRDDVMKVPLSYQSTMIHAVEEVLEEVKKENANESNESESILAEYGL
jgi:hypothetical protein